MINDKAFYVDTSILCNVFIALPFQQQQQHGVRKRLNLSTRTQKNLRKMKKKIQVHNLTYGNSISKNVNVNMDKIIKIIHIY